MLAHVKILSMWEVAHYWHDCDPRVSQTHHLPLKVRDTLLVFSMEFGNSLSIRVEQDQAYKLEIYKAAPKLTARHYRHSFKNAIDKKVFGKRFFSKMFITRSQLARWCISKNEPLPKFWFPDNDKFPYIAEGDLTDEITANGRYKVQLLYDDRKKPSNNEAPQEQPIVATVNENASKAAHAKNAPVNAIKERFVHFHQAQESKFPSMTASARSFYFQLSTEDKQRFSNKEAAIRTLRSALSQLPKE
jgi:hypothetical protein